MRQRGLWWPPADVGLSRTREASSASLAPAPTAFCRVLCTAESRLAALSVRIPRILIRNHETPACSTAEPAQLGPWEPGESATTFLALCAVHESLRQEENLLPSYPKGFYSSRVAMGCLWPMSLGALWCPSRPLHHARVLVPSFPQPPKAPRPTQTHTPLFGARPLPLQCLAMMFHTTVHRKHCNVSCRKVILVYHSR